MEDLLLKAKIKQYLAKSFSLFLLGHGLFKLGSSLLETFSLVKVIQGAETIPHEEFQLALKTFLVETIESTIETIYGMILFFTHSHKLKFLHLAIGLLIFLLPWLINNRILQDVETKLPPLVMAQETSPEQALSDYQFQLQKYREAHQEYLKAKNLYLSFQTLNSKAAAIEATKTLLIRRAEVLRTYLLALRVRLSPHSLTSKLSAEETYLTGYQKDIPSITDIAELTKTSQELEAKFPQIQVLGYQSLHAILVGEQQTLAINLKQHHQTLTKLVSEASSSEINQPQANQWLSDINQAFAQNQTDYIDTDKKIKALNPKVSLTIPNSRDFAKVLTTLDLTRNRLLQIINFLRETISLLKYG